MNYGLNKKLYCGVNIYIYKLDLTKVGIRQIANEPLYTCKTLKETVGGKRLTSYNTTDRKVPSWVEVYNLLTNKPIFAMPFCYFENHDNYKNYGEIYGRCQGVNINNKPDQEAWLDAVITKENRLKLGDDMGQLASWEEVEVNCGFSPCLILLKDKVVRKLYSPASGWGKYNTKNTQTFIAQDAETLYLGVVDGLIYPSTISVWLENFGVTDVMFGDSGGSAYAYYREENEPKEEETPDEPISGDSGTIQLHVDTVGMYIRKTLEFKGTKSCGQILRTVKVGQTAEVVEFIDGIQPDGYQWVKVRFENIVGYAQYDSQCYWLEQK